MGRQLPAKRATARGAFALVAIALATLLSAAPAGAQIGVIDQYVPPGTHHHGGPSSSPGGGQHSGGHAAGGTTATGGGSGGAGGGGGAGGHASSGRTTAAASADASSGASSPASDPSVSERGGGSLPSGYPVTPLIWGLIALVAAAIVASVLFAGRRRRLAGRRHAA